MLEQPAVLFRLQPASWCGLLAWLLLACSEQSVQTPRSGGPELPSASARKPLLGLPAPSARGAPFRRGIVLGPLRAPEDEPGAAAFKREHARQLDHAVALGATDVQLLVRWYQVDARSTEIYPYDSVHDDLLSWLLKQAQRRKLRVFLSPVLALARGDDTRTRGELAPRGWESWWWSYRRVVLHYARVSARHKLALYSVGAGLTSTERQTASWRKLIRDVRKIYKKGQLTYLASAESFHEIAFWDALDVLSIDLAQPSARSEEPLLEWLTALRERLEGFSKSRALGYLISESRSDAGSDEEGALREQRALFQSFREDALLRGVYVRGALPEAASGKSAPAPGGAAAIVHHWYSKSKI